METIASTVEAVEIEDDSRPPRARMITIQCPPRVTDRRGDDLGAGETITIPALWEVAARKLVEAGWDRAVTSANRGRDGKHLLRVAWTKIRHTWFDAAAPAGIPQTTAAKLVGVSRAQFHTIINTVEED